LVQRDRLDYQVRQTVTTRCAPPKGQHGVQFTRTHFGVVKCLYLLFLGGDCFEMYFHLILVSRDAD
jgi:hypothetical protein